MKKFVSKVVLLAVALVLATGMFVNAQSVLHEFETGDGDVYDANQISFDLGADLLDAADVFVLEHDGMFGDWGFHLAIYEGAIDWTSVSESGHALLTIEDGRLVFDISGFEGAERIRIGTWNGNVGIDSITRMYLAAGASAATPAAPADADATPVSDTVNPQTGDDFNPTWLIVSGVGLLASLVAVVIFKKKK
ncbi:MAG: LPXTG cell wall anchor domain-containing protein [Defluviitaleaceae bacterium]|nr:LPXTG cell wall anchor domain-containing protein [Defluviitaleaceae bacterium]